MARPRKPVSWIKSRALGTNAKVGLREHGNWACECSGSSRGDDAERSDNAAAGKGEKLVKLKCVEIENFRAIDKLQLPLHPSLTVLHGDNAHGKTSVLSAIAVGLGSIPTLLPNVSGVGFRKTDPRRIRSAPLVTVTTTDGVAWQRRRNRAGKAERRTLSQRTLKEVVDAIVIADQENGEPLDLPIIAFYGTNRAVAASPLNRKGFGKDFHRFASLAGALAARANFQDFAEWFYAWENEELREQKERRDFGYRLKELEAVRKAITSMVPGASDLRIKHRPRRFMLSFKLDSGQTETLSLNQLSGGYRIVLAVAGDLARRMAHGNPHLTDPLASEAIVLIDEIELHLHPSWQQHILTDLTRTFPNTQFIVSTHSPPVLTTLRPEQIVTLRRENGRVAASRVSEPTYGAEAGDVLNVVMGVGQRPNGNEFVEALESYMRLVSGGRGESTEAQSLRHKLDTLSPRDPALDRADIEIRRHKLLKKMGKSQ